MNAHTFDDAAWPVAAPHAEASEAVDVAAHRPNAAMLRRLLSFNQGGSTEIDPSWFDPREALWVNRLGSCRSAAARRHVNQWIRERFTLHSHLDVDFHTLEKRVFLIERELMGELCLWLGASLWARPIRSVVLRDEVAQLHLLFGADNLRLLLNSFSDESHDSGVQIGTPRGTPTGSELSRLGVHCLLALAEYHGPGVSLRTRLKLPKEVVTSRSGVVFNLRDPAIASHHLMLVTMLFLPSLRWLFFDTTITRP